MAFKTTLLFRPLTVAALCAAACVATVPAAAQTDLYVEGRIGLSVLQDSDNDGRFNGDFATGEGTTVPGGTVLPDGTDVGWRTEFDDGFSGGIALGKRYGAFRSELAFAWQKNDVDTHKNVVAGGIALGGEDAGVLVSGSDNLGVSVADLVAAGRGDVKTQFLMLNGYYDVDTGTPVTPFIGAGLGIGFVDVTYAPSDVTIIEDESTALAYQVMVGASFEATPQLEIIASYRYRGTEDVGVNADLFSADFDIENRASLLEFGVRYSF